MSDQSSQSMDDLAAQFGEEWSDGSRVEFKKPLRPLDNASIEVGILTQMGDLRGDPDGWKKYHRLHWGAVIPQRKDPSKTRKIRFYCTREWGRGRTIAKECPMCAWIERQREESDALENRYKLERRSAEEILTLMAPFNAWFRTFNTDGKWYMYGMTPAGEFNRVLLSHKVFQDLEAEMRNVQRDLQINPRSPKNLVIFKITRVGSGKQAGSMLEKVEQSTEPKVVDGKTYRAVKQIALTVDQMQQAVKEYVSLNDADAFRLTDAQIQQIVDSDQDAENIARIIGEAPAGKPARAVVPPADKEREKGTYTPPTPPVGGWPTPPAKDAASEPAATPPEDDEEAQALAALAAARARKAQKVAQVAADVQATVAATQKVLEAAAEVASPKAPAVSTKTSLADMDDKELFAYLQIDPQAVGLPAPKA